ncbi:hypothetical protein ACOBV8_20800 (plasmid) [Pseudoalteromonas espejiana]
MFSRWLKLQTSTVLYCLKSNTGEFVAASLIVSISFTLYGDKHITQPIFHTAVAIKFTNSIDHTTVRIYLGVFKLIKYVLAKLGSPILLVLVKNNTAGFESQ